MQMHKTVGQEMSNRAAAESRQHALLIARKEARIDTLVKLSGHFDRMATDIANKGMSSTEIVELLRQVAENMSRGRVWSE
ncbi:TPA: DUF2732 family protein [Yersinia enterocolitica]|nr:DUF2732 family protein [Yersinia enterocolitica]